MKSRRVIALLIAMLLALSLLPVSVLATPAVANPDDLLPVLPEGYTYYGNRFVDSDGNVYFYITYAEGELGLSEGYWIDVNGNEVSDPRADGTTEKVWEPEDLDAAGSLPSSYDARNVGGVSYVTSVKDQGSTGTCWAHASLAALESNAIKKGYGTAEELDLNVFHTVWNSLNGYYSGITASGNDGYVCDESEILDTAGNAYYAADAFLNFSGCVTQSLLPISYTPYNDTALLQEMKTKLTYDNKFARDVTAIDVLEIGTDVTTIKQALLEYGGLYLRFDCFNDNFTKSTNGYCTYYHPESTAYVEGGHAVELIGWDDNFSKNNFPAKARPSSDGAWLLKNSWGSDWGANDGYFWMSYENHGANSKSGSARDPYTVYAIVAADPDDFEKVFLHNGCDYGSEVSALKAANVFQTDEDVQLTKFSVGKECSYNYTLRIYRLRENYTSPVDGTEIYKQTGTFSSNEMYEEIIGDVELDAGDIFSVIVERSSSGTFPAEGSSGNARKYTSNTGDSYYYSGGSWKDAKANGYNNLCIRAVAKTIGGTDGYRVQYGCTDENGVFQVHQQKWSDAAGNVALPDAIQGYTWELSYGGEEFDGTGVTENIQVEAHCYPTDGAICTEECEKQYECIYCGKAMRQAEEYHTIGKYVKEAALVTPLSEIACNEPAQYYYSCQYCDKLDESQTFTSGYGSVHDYDSTTGKCKLCGGKCSCDCHATGLRAIRWVILRFIYRFFGISRTCACGRIHY